MNDVSTLELKVDGKPGEIDLKALEKSLAAVSKLLNAVGGKNSTQHVGALRTGSAVIEISTEHTTVAMVTRGLEALASGNKPTESFNRTALSAIRDLYDINRYSGVTGVSLGTINQAVAINTAVKNNAEDLLAMHRHSLGSVTGVLYKYNGRDGDLRAGLLDSRTGKSVELELGLEHRDIVLESMDSAVRVRGLLIRDSATNEVTKVKVTQVTKLKPRTIQRPARELQGILGTDWLDGSDPVELVRRERGA